MGDIFDEYLGLLEAMGWIEMNDAVVDDRRDF
jgi:hypothetical protein